MQKILIVDDDHLVADTLALIFKKSGFLALVAYSADEALASARTFFPDLLLSDICMPGRDGLSLIADITREHPACRIIAITGFYSKLENVLEHASNRVRPLGIVLKPCQPKDLLREASAILSAA